MVFNFYIHEYAQWVHTNNMNVDTLDYFNANNDNCNQNKIRR